MLHISQRAITAEGPLGGSRSFAALDARRGAPPSTMDWQMFPYELRLNLLTDAVVSDVVHAALERRGQG